MSLFSYEVCKENKHNLMRSCELLQTNIESGETEMVGKVENVQLTYCSDDVKIEQKVRPDGFETIYRKNDKAQCGIITQDAYLIV